jgi:hypothetical protein
MRRKLKKRSPGPDARRQNPRLELVSGETVVGAAIAEVLADYFGTDFISFSTTSGGAYPDITRSLVSFSAARTKTRYRASWPKFIIGRISRKDSKWDSAFGNYVFQSYLKPLP